MNKMHLWGAFMSLCGLGIGMVVFKLGITPIMETHMFGLKQDEQIVYGSMSTLGLVTIVQCAQKFSDCLIAFIEGSISSALERRKDRKRKQELLANATPIFESEPIIWNPAPVPSYVPAAPAVTDQMTPAFTSSTRM